MRSAAIEATKEQLGVEPQLRTDGGTSDARFISAHGAQVIELGPVNSTIHQVNECVSVEDLEKLSKLYQLILEKLNDQLR